MEQSQMILFIIRLILEGAVAFLAIVVWSKTRDEVWMCLTAGTVFSYSATVYSLIKTLGISFKKEWHIAGISISDLISVVLPALFFIAAFVLFLLRDRRRHN